MIKDVDDFSAYARLKIAGRSAEEAYAKAKKEGLDPFTCIRMLRSVYNLSLVEAKEVTVIVETKSSSLMEHEARLLPVIRKVLDEENADSE